MISGVRHTGIVVNDLDGAINFWVDLLGFEIVSNELETGDFIDRLLSLKDVFVQTVKLVAKDETMIELLHFESHPSKEIWSGTPYSNGLTHVALNTFELSALVARLSTHGFNAMNEIQVSPSGNVRVCYLSGFEGVLLELVEVIRI
jgi:catechol 2,3-dioxygenase-like lactoylglutathione lyase family enzyme